MKAERARGNPGGDENSDLILRAAEIRADGPLLRMRTDAVVSHHLKGSTPRGPSSPRSQEPARPARPTSGKTFSERFTRRSEEAALLEIAPLPETEHATAEWHRLGSTEVLTSLGVTRDGLDPEAALQRLSEHGANELVDMGSSSPWRLVWEQVSAVMVLILIGAAVLSLTLGKYLEAGAIGAIVVLFTLLGFFQEYRAEQAIAALRKMAVPIVRVVRGGRTMEVAAADVVPGDIVKLEAGSIVPADVRLIEVANLRIEEATLTGESEPANKQVEPIDRERLALGDRRCMAYSGTQVTAGRGVGAVVATGMETELGRIATMLQNVESEDTPLQARLDRVGKQLALIGLVVAGLVVVMGAVGGESASDLVLTAISVAVAVIPEGLPAVVTFTLAIGSQRMLRREALIRKLPAVETLGSVTVICSDKTGTLTQNKMTVTMLDVADHEVLVEPRAKLDQAQLPVAARLMLGAIVLCNDAHSEIDDNGLLAMIGDPTETALLRIAHEAGIDIRDLQNRVARSRGEPVRLGTQTNEHGSRSIPEHLAGFRRPPTGSADLLCQRCDRRADRTRHQGVVDRRPGRHRRRMATTPTRAANDRLAANGAAYSGSPTASMMDRHSTSPPRRRPKPSPSSWFSASSGSSTHLAPRSVMPSPFAAMPGSDRMIVRGTTARRQSDRHRTRHRYQRPCAHRCNLDRLSDAEFHEAATYMSVFAPGVTRAQAGACRCVATAGADRGYDR